MVNNISKLLVVNVAPNGQVTLVVQTTTVIKQTTQAPPQVFNNAQAAVAALQTQYNAAPNAATKRAIGNAIAQVNAQAALVPQAAPATPPTASAPAAQPATATQNESAPSTPAFVF